MPMPTNDNLGHECTRCDGDGFYLGTQYEPEWKHAVETMIVCDCTAGKDMMDAGERARRLRAAATTDGTD